MRKKSPLTLKQFEDFFRLLPSQADSENSWTVDMDEKKSQAAEEAQPHKEESAAKKRTVAQWSEKLQELKKVKPRNEKAVSEAEEKVKDLNREVRELESKVKEIEDAVYDLKAVNPHKIQVVDTRTPEELIELIKAKGNEIADALKALG